jgi:hypothetical protein
VFLLAQLLKGNQRPNLVVFLDGLNEWTCGDVPHFTQNIADATHNLQFERALSLLDQFGWLPIVRLSESRQQADGGALVVSIAGPKG